MASSVNFVALPGSERPLAPGAVLLGPADPASTVQLTLIVRPQPGSEPLPSLDYWQKAPLGNRRYPSVEEFADKYGAAQSDLDAVASYARSQGLSVLEVNAARRSVVVCGTALQVNAAVRIQLNRYRTPVPTSRRRRTGVQAQNASVHRGFEGQAHLPEDVAPLVLAILGLDNRKLGGVNNDDPPNVLPVSTPTIAQLYNFPNTGAADQTIGIFSGGGNYLPSDVTSYFASLPAGYQTVPTLVDVNLTVDGTTFSNNTSAVGTQNGDYEIGQDIQLTATIAQGATIAIYHSEDTEDGYLAWLNAAVLPNAGQPTPSVLTNSWLLSRDDQNLGSMVLDTLSNAFAAAAARGITVFIALGDSGSNDSVGDQKPHVQYPGSDPWVTSCGGTTVGNVQNGPPLTFQEVAWSESDIGEGATGGGVSAYFKSPPYQTAAGITGATDSGGTTHSGRAVPDVAANASPVSAYSGIQIGGSSFGGNGTSAVAPLYAGLFAVINQAFGQQMGFINPLIYQLGESLFSDITVGNNDSGNGTPYFSAGPGWDACTGLGRFDGTKLVNGIAGMLYTQTLYFLMGKNTFGLDEVTVESQYPTAFWLVLEGFTPNAVSGLSPTVEGSFATTPGVTVTVGAAMPELSAYPDTPQRILYPCTVDFAAASIASQSSSGIFPNPGSSSDMLTVSCELTVLSTPLSASAAIVLVAGADPFFVNINPALNNVFYLSQDIRVFTVTPGLNNTPISGMPGAPALLPASATALDTAAGYGYIQSVLGYLNLNYSDPAGTDPFTLFPDQWGEWDGDSSVAPVTIDPSHPTNTPFSNYNFAVARVRLSDAPGSTTADNVKVFFRLFATETSDTDYLPSSTYPSTLDASSLPASPLIGIGDVTIPFFATGNYETNGDFAVNTDYSANSVNNQAITVGASGEVWAYYGCYLNFYAPANTIGGTPVLSLLPSSHCCLVAQIAYDDAPIPTSGPTIASPENSDKLAQRNLAVTLSDNPGPPETHRVPQTFDVRPSATFGSEKGELLNYPDELMIDWGNTPVGSTANIYWPEVNSSAVLSLAKSLYSTQQLSAADPHTVQCKVQQGLTYVPIPTGTGAGFAGLFTIDLPQGVVSGQQFVVTVRRIATHRVKSDSTPVRINAFATTGSRDNQMRNWRYLTGSFAVQIPVSGPRRMLPREESTLAVMKWKLEQTLATSRWYPVLQRYLTQIAGRVKGLGGNPGAIVASPQGYIPQQPNRAGKCDRDECGTAGKISSVCYDRFGDFCGFELSTLEGRELRFHCDQRDLEELVRSAWRDRVLITIISYRHEPHRPVSIILRRQP